jgi:plastocyanin
MSRHVALLVASVLTVGMVAAAGGAQAAPMAWHVGIGADSADHAVQLLDYYPRTITIHVGDRITWSMTALNFHTVTFLSGQKPPALDLPQQDGRVQINPAVAFPQGGATYDGTGLASSGILMGPGKSWTLTFTKSGRYSYVCLLHPAQTGTVVVEPAGARLPMAQEDYDRLSAQQRTQSLAAGAKLRAATHATVSKGNHGDVYTAPMVGDAGARVALYRFGTDTLTVKVGDTVRWVMQDPDEIHTVTFAGTEQAPDFLLMEPQPQGPPKVYYNPKAVIPAGGVEHRGNGFYNSGILLAVNPPGPTEYTLTFTTPGRFTYWCTVHVMDGMRGTVIVR